MFPKKVQEKLQIIPNSSGVYFMLDTHGQIIYIGKALSLTKRVKSYFSISVKEKKVLAMVECVCDIDYAVTLSEKDALSLEANLIKKHKPKYNILLKDDKHAPYIRINLKEKYPNLSVVRRITLDGAKYFGPYFFGVRVNDILDILRSCYQVRVCGNNFNKAKRACLNYDIELCKAPCQKLISEEEYRHQIEKVIAFLSGSINPAKEILEDKMGQAADREDFEGAIKYREQLTMVAKLKERIIAGLENEGKDLDAFSITTRGEHAAVSVVVCRHGKLMGVKNSIHSGVLEKEQALEQFIAQYYSGQIGDIPKTILLSQDMKTEGLSEFLTTLAGKKIEVVVPKIGIKKKLVDMADKNASEQLVKSIEGHVRDYDRHEGAAERLTQILGIPSCKRIECYDVSHMSGENQVASGVCFINGRPEKKEYRRYKIKSHSSIDDYLSLKEVIDRRIKKGELPNLFVIDGGKGQLSAAQEIIKNNGVVIDMISLAERDEWIFVPNNPEPIILEKSDTALQLLQRIRDEAHRFAVDYHRTLRSKKQVFSELDEIKGIGKTKRQILLKAFNYKIDEIKKSSFETLVNIKGIDKKTAQAVVGFFEGNF